QPHIQVSVDLCVGDQRFQIRCSSCIGREQLDSRMKSDFANGLRNTRVAGPLQALLKFIYTNDGRISLSDEDQIVTVSVEVIAPNGAARENREKRCQFGLNRFQIAIVNRKPLRYHAAWVQVTFD